jgi:hypothetical protein
LEAPAGQLESFLRDSQVDPLCRTQRFSVPPRGVRIGLLLLGRQKNRNSILCDRSNFLARLLVRLDSIRLTQCQRDDCLPSNLTTTKLSEIVIRW